jgi:hypothetical protein
MQLGGIAGADEADLPPTVRRSLPSFHGGLLDVSLELGTIVRPTFLVTAKDSPLAFAEATDLLAQATLSARVECIDLEVDSTLQAFCKHRASAGMSPCSA